MKDYETLKILYGDLIELIHLLEEAYHFIDKDLKELKKNYIKMHNDLEKLIEDTSDILTIVDKSTPLEKLSKMGLNPSSCDSYSRIKNYSKIVDRENDVLTLEKELIICKKLINQIDALKNKFETEKNMNLLFQSLQST